MSVNNVNTRLIVGDSGNVSIRTGGERNPIRDVYLLISELIAMLEKFANAVDDSRLRHQAQIYLDSLKAAREHFKSMVDQAIGGIVGAGLAVVMGVLPVVFGALRLLFKDNSRVGVVASPAGAGRHPPGAKDNTTVGVTERTNVEKSLDESDELESVIEGFADGRGSSSSTGRSLHSSAVIGERDHQVNNRSGLSSRQGIHDFLTRLQKLCETLGLSSAMAFPSVGQSSGALAAAPNDLDEAELKAIIQWAESIEEELKRRAADTNSSIDQMNRTLAN